MSELKQSTIQNNSSDDEGWNDLGVINLNDKIMELIGKADDLDQEFKTRVQSILIGCAVEDAMIPEENLTSSSWKELESLIQSNNLDVIINIGFVVLALSSKQCLKIKGAELIWSMQNSLSESRLIEKKEKKLEAEKEEARAIMKVLEEENKTFKADLEAKDTKLTELCKFYWTSEHLKFRLNC